MMKIVAPYRLATIVLAAACVVLPVHGEEVASPSLSIEQAVIARAVESRQPVGEASRFSAEVGQIACFTKVLGADEETFIEHVWLQGETERARVRLAVRGPAWRTWSTKRIDPAWTGSWMVRIEDAKGNLLDTLAFIIEKDAEQQENGG